MKSESDQQLVLERLQASLYMLLLFLLLGMVKEKDIIADMRENTARGIWKGPD